MQLEFVKEILEKIPGRMPEDFSAWIFEKNQIETFPVKILYSDSARNHSACFSKMLPSISYIVLVEICASVASGIKKKVRYNFYFLPFQCGTVADILP